MPRVAVAVILLLLCVSVSPQARDQPRSSSDISDLLDRYERGEHDAVAAELDRGVDFKAILTEAKKPSPKRKHEVIAAFLLEAAAVAAQIEFHPRLPHDPLGVQVPNFPDPLSFMDLFAESFAAAYRAPAGTPFDRAWHRAAISLLDGTVETSPQSDGPGKGGAIMGSTTLGSTTLGDKGNYLHRMANRLDPSTALLAKAALQESVVWTMVSYNLPTYRGARTASGASLSGGLAGSLESAVEEGIARLTEAQRYDEVRAEATVRRGMLTWSRNKKGDAEAALQLFREAQQLPGDSWSQYLAHFLEGRVLESRGQLTQAAAAYQAALAITPTAQSGRLALAALQFTQGTPEPAYSLIQNVLSSPRGADDPWALYHYGDYRNWPMRVRAMREALR